MTLQTSEFVTMIPKDVDLLGLARATGIKPTFDPQTGKMNVYAPECRMPPMAKGELRASLTPSVRRGKLHLTVDSATVGDTDVSGRVTSAMFFKSPADDINKILDSQGLKLEAVSVQKDGVRLKLQRK